jgi:hypothetical protein
MVAKVPETLTGLLGVALAELDVRAIDASGAIDLTLNNGYTLLKKESRLM